MQRGGERAAVAHLGGGRPRGVARADRCGERGRRDRLPRAVRRDLGDVGRALARVADRARRARAARALGAARARGDRARGEEARARRLVAGIGAALGAAEGYGVSFGRHFASWALRAPFVVIVGLAGAAAAWILAPRIARASRERPRALAAVAAGIAALGWCADALVLPRLYPAFHAALLALTLAAAALGSLALARARSPRARSRGPPSPSRVGCAAWAPRAAARLHSADNLRLVLVEHAPDPRPRRRARRVDARRLREDDARRARGLRRADGPPRALDWTGRDVARSSRSTRCAPITSAPTATRARPRRTSIASPREGALFEPRTARRRTPRTRSRR